MRESFAKVVEVVVVGYPSHCRHQQHQHQPAMICPSISAGAAEAHCRRLKQLQQQQVLTCCVR